MRWTHAAPALLLIGLGPPAIAQTIQLPSFSSFSVNTSVIVPDSGPSPLARDRRATSGANHFNGVAPRHGIGLNAQSSAVGVKGQIHDPREAEQALSLKAKGQQTKVADMPGGRNKLAPAAGDPGLSSVAAIKQQRAEKLAAADRDAHGLVERARQAATSGNAPLATTLYRQAASQATPALKQTIDAEAKALRATAAKSGGKTVKNR